MRRWQSVALNNAPLLNTSMNVYCCRSGKLKHIDERVLLQAWQAKHIDEQNVYHCRIVKLNLMSEAHELVVTHFNIRLMKLDKHNPTISGSTYSGY